MMFSEDKAKYSALGAARWQSWFGERVEEEINTSCYFVDSLDTQESFL
jgi:hypothetical protein